MMRRIMKSFLYRSAETAYAVLPKRAVLAFYGYLTYVLRNVTWRLACKYYGPRMTERRREMASFVLSHVSAGDRVLDVGCAEGNLTRLIAGKAGSVTAVEIDRRYLDMIDMRAGVFAHTRFLHGDILSLGLEGTFDVAVLIHVIEHMEKSEAVLRLLSRIARTIVIETPDESSDWMTELVRDMGIDDCGDDKHFKLYDTGLLKRELEENGWTDVEVSIGSGVVRAAARSRVLEGRTVCV